MKTFHDFTVNDIKGNPVSLASFSGQKIMVVNVASECGLTPQYAILQELYEKYKDQSFTIIGFPANNFGAQEPGSDEQILSFCQREFQVSFPMMSKISVKGADQHEVYQWLTHRSENGVSDSEVEWNFQKYLIDEKGQLADVVAPADSPAEEKIIKWIEG